jgi:hypothetical protein
MRLLEVWKRPAGGGPIALRPVAGAALHYPRRQGVGDAVADRRHVAPRIEGTFDVIGQAPVSAGLQINCDESADCPQGILGSGQRSEGRI